MEYHFSFVHFNAFRHMSMVPHYQIGAGVDRGITYLLFIHRQFVWNCDTFVENDTQHIALRSEFLDISLHCFEATRFGKGVDITGAAKISRRFVMRNDLHIGTSILIKGRPLPHRPNAIIVQKTKPRAAAFNDGRNPRFINVQTGSGDGNT